MARGPTISHKAIVGATQPVVKGLYLYIENLVEKFFCMEMFRALVLFRKY